MTTREDETIEVRVRQLQQLSPTKAEQRIARAILSNYPFSAMKTVTVLGLDSSTSPATILRFVAKLGLSGYPDFQRAVRDELETRAESPLTRLTRSAGSKEGSSTFQRYSAFAIELMRETRELISPQEFDLFASHLADLRQPVWLIGGRYSRGLALLMDYGLTSLRGGVRLVAPDTRSMVDALSNIKRRDIVVVFDFRRYPPDVISFAEEAARQGAHLLLITDRDQSPCHAVASCVLAVPVASPSPFDSGLAALLCVELLIAQLAEKMDEASRDRVARVESLYAQLSCLPKTGN